MIRRLVSIGLLFLMVAVIAGCQDLTSSERPQPKQYAGMDLVGDWLLYMRLETSISNLVKFIMHISEETCQTENECMIFGYLEEQGTAENKKVIFSGYSFPKSRIVRLSYTDRDATGNLYDAIVELDLHPTGIVANRAMVGYWVEFERAAPGPHWPDSILYDASGRGMMNLAGRAAALPIE